MNKYLSQATTALLFFLFLSSFLESNFKNEIKNFTKIPPIIIGIPPAHLNVTV